MSNLKNFTARELTSKHACLMDESVVSPEKKQEIKAIEKDLRRRLYSLLLGDVLPVIITAKEDS